MYQSIRPWLFRIDAEKAHNQIITLLHLYRHLAPVRSLTRILHQPKAAAFQWENLTFKNRVGLSAGFDKEASCFDELSDWGFGFIEVGTVTPEKVAGNPSPRIFRLPKDNALVSRTGFNNPGKDVFLKTCNGNKKANTFWESISTPIIRTMRNRPKPKWPTFIRHSANMPIIIPSTGEVCLLKF